ncbi:hypothetical protein POVCU2_0087500, partial [Plasmodium ovale curtisi]
TDHSKFILSSYLFDRKLIKEFCQCFYCSFCDNGAEIFENDYKYRIFCYNFVENVEIVYNKNKENPKLKKKRCKLLESLVSYNIHGNCVSSLHANYNNIDKLNTVLEMINTETSNKSKNHVFIKKINKSFYSSEWTKIKDINDYGENYDFIRNKSSMKDSDCYAFYNYLTKNSDLHKEIVDRYSKSRTRNGTWLFNRLKKKKILKDTLHGNYENEMLEDNYKHSDEDLSNIPLHITYQTS